MKPTLNAHYNALLVKWGTPGNPCAPECEDCGCDMTGMQVTDAPGMWVCPTCASVERQHVPIYREDFEAGCYREV